MVSVSDRFMELAQQNGRKVWCRIVADGVEFLDDSLIEMSFDDVVHPDWFTIGTTCANRLHFIAKYGGELSSGAEVTAFISFDGEEWCQLGVFYISRRYVRGDIVNVTAYDRMYSLDNAFSYKGELPVGSDVLLQQICSDNGILCDDPGYPFSIEKIPEDSTVRDVIGYIAGINRACAKMDRHGRLVLKTPQHVDFNILDKSCWSVQRNMVRSVVTCMKVNTGEGELTAGGGAEISTLELYDPFMTQAILDNIYSMFKPFSFYGAELEMQGLPFLEAGDMVYFLDGDMLYPIVISEIEYTYNGGLSAKLSSKNRVDDDDGGELEDLLERLLHMKDAVYYKRENPGQIALTSSPQIIADFEFETTEDCFAQLDVNFTLRNSNADLVTLTVNVNGREVPRSFIQSLGSGDELIHLYHLVDKLPAGKNRVYVTAGTRTGSSYIAVGDMQATLVGHGIYGNSGSQRDKVSFYEKASYWRVGSPFVVPDTISGEISGEVT